MTEPAPDRDPATDRSRLVGAAYATPEPLMARAALYAFEREPLDFVAWVLDLVEARRPITPRSRVVDIGCGPGRYVAALHARHPGIATVGLDLSPGMAAATLASGTPAAVADAMHLPIRTASCDVAIAAHMLYHVPDIAAAAGELARVVGTAGVVAIATNGAHHLQELNAVTSEAFAAISGAEWTAPARVGARFLLDNAAALIAPALDVVALERTSHEIVVPDPAPIVAYVASLESFYGPVLPSGTTWDDVLGEVETRAAAIVARDGAFVVHSESGVLLCAAR